MVIVVQLALILTSLPFLVTGIRRLFTARLMKDTPTSKIGSAHQGYVEIKGRTAASPSQGLYVPLLKIPCVWYRYEAFFENKQQDPDAVELQESYQRFLVKDSSGVCAVDPRFAEVRAKKVKEIIKTGVKYRCSWIGIDDAVYALGWMNTLHPMPQVPDELQHNKNPDTQHKIPKLRYGQLKEPLNTIIKPHNEGLPFIISAAFEHQAHALIRFESFVWLLGYVLVGVVFPSLIQILYVS